MWKIMIVPVYIHLTENKRQIWKFRHWKIPVRDLRCLGHWKGLGRWWRKGLEANDYCFLLWLDQTPIVVFVCTFHFQAKVNHMRARNHRLCSDLLLQKFSWVCISSLASPTPGRVADCMPGHWAAMEKIQDLDLEMRK